jgi:hypothetical protein
VEVDKLAATAAIGAQSWRREKCLQFAVPGLASFGAASTGKRMLGSFFATFRSVKH